VDVVKLKKVDNVVPSTGGGHEEARRGQQRTRLKLSNTHTNVAWLGLLEALLVMALLAALALASIVVASMRHVVVGVAHVLVAIDVDVPQKATIC
jgi:hypothetical protein